MMCAKCGKWVHGRCAKMKRVTSTLAKVFVRELALIQSNCGRNIIFDRVDFVKTFAIWKTG